MISKIESFKEEFALRSVSRKVAHMKNLKQIQKVLASSKAELRKLYNVQSLGIFGSYARGEQKKTSDLDVLVKFNSNASLFDFVGLGNHLEELLGMKVDIVSERGLRPELKSNILKGVAKV